MAGTQYFANSGEPRPDDGSGNTAPLPRVPAGVPGPPPPRFPPGQAAQPARRLPVTLLKVAGLVAVALVSGLLWWVIRQDTGQPQQAVAVDPLTSGQFQYRIVAGPEGGSDCATHSYGKVKDWFAEHPCAGLSRALYITETSGQRALVSVVQVVMPSPELAQQLKVITDTDNTGNVSDLVRDGTATIPGAPEVAGGEYDSAASGAAVTIVEARLFANGADQALLARITEDALRLGGVSPE